MEVKYSTKINGLGLFATQQYKKCDTILVLKGDETSYPTRESIYVGNNIYK